MDKKEKFLKICPQCGSTDVKIPPAGLDMKMSMPDYCQKCKNRGIFPEIRESEIEKFRKNIKEKN